MYSSTKSQIIELIEKNGHAQVKELVQVLGITQAAVHRALNKLIAEKILIKKGSPPQVFYFLNPSKSILDLIDLSKAQADLLDRHYSYIQPTGTIVPGLKGFLSWMQKTQNKQKQLKSKKFTVGIFQSHKSLYQSSAKELKMRKKQCSLSLIKLLRRACSSSMMPWDQVQL